MAHIDKDFATVLVIPIPPLGNDNRFVSYFDGYIERASTVGITDAKVGLEVFCIARRRAVLGAHNRMARQFFRPVAQIAVDFNSCERMDQSHSAIMSRSRTN